MCASNAFGIGFGWRKADALLKGIPEFCTLNGRDLGFVASVPGLSDATIEELVKKLPQFKAWYKDCRLDPKRLVYSEPTIELDSNLLKGQVFTFTGVRDKELADHILANGGQVSDSLSSKTTTLICKDKGSSSAKMQKAEAMKINIWSLEDARYKIYNQAY
jgi:NAD-dependent DNA ligase